MAGSDGVPVLNLIREAGGNNFRRENTRSEFKTSVQIEKLWLTFRCYSNILGKQIQTQGSVFVFRQGFSRLIQLVKGKSHKLGYYQEEKAKNEFVLKKLTYTVPFFINRRHSLSSLF